MGTKFALDESIEQLSVTRVLVLDGPVDGPTSKAGLKTTKLDAYGQPILGDIITTVNGKKVCNGSDLYRVLDLVVFKVGILVPKNCIDLDLYSIYSNH